MTCCDSCRRAFEICLPAEAILLYTIQFQKVDLTLDEWVVSDAVVSAIDQFGEDASTVAVDDAATVWSANNVTFKIIGDRDPGVTYTITLKATMTTGEEIIAEGQIIS